MTASSLTDGALSRGRLMNWLKECLSSVGTSSVARELIDLVSIVDHSEAFPPSKEYDLYSGKIKAKLRDLGSEQEARHFVVDTYILSLNVLVPPVVVYYPPLREYVKQYYRNPELLVVLFDYAGAVGETEKAGEWLSLAHKLDPGNEYVLWQRIIARGSPWYPADLIHDSNPLQDELWLVSRLLKRNPNDPLASALKSRLTETKTPLSSLGSINFLNSLRLQVPHPMTHVGMPSLLDPRRLSLPSIKGVFERKPA